MIILFLVFFYEVEVILLDGNCVGYFCVVYSFSENVILDGDVFSEWVFFVDISIYRKNMKNKIC